MRSSLLVFLFASSVACGGAISNDSDAAPTGDDAGPQADAAPDTLLTPPYGACFDDNGDLNYDLKGCQSDDDCVIKEEQTDCCGTIEYVGVNTSSASEFDQCEAAWVDHFPGCGCASGQKKTEDGKTTYPGQDAGAPQVHCTDFTMSGGVCLTYTP